MRIESRKAQTLAQQVVGHRSPRRRIDAQSNGAADSVRAETAGAGLYIRADVHAGAKQEPRAMVIYFGEAETRTIRARLAERDAAMLAAYRALRDDVAAFVSDASHGLGPDLIRLIRALERAP